MLRKPPACMAFVLSLVVVFACRLAAPAPTSTSPPPSDTVPAPSETPLPTPSNTPEPIPTGTPEPSPTPSRTHTATPDLAATAAFESTQAEAEILEQVGAVLQGYGISTDEGRLGWFGIEPMELAVQNFGTIIYEPVAEMQAFDDILLNVDITWDSSSGLAGCGVIFRSEPDLRDGEQYMLRTLRLSGLPAWSVEHWDFGEIVTTLRVEPNAAILIGPGSVNNFVLLLDGSTLTLYANGVRLTGLTVNRRAAGRIAFLAWQESGVTTCLFENAWIWELGD